MGRRKITEEAEEQAGEQDSEQDETDGAGDDREPLTQRMPKDLVNDVDEIAEYQGISRNAAINMMCRRMVPKMKEELGLE